DREHHQERGHPYEREGAYIAIELDAHERERFDPEEAIRSTGEIDQLVEKHDEDRVPTERRHRQIVSAQTQYRQPDDARRRSRDQRCRRKRKPGSQAKLDVEDAAGIGAQAEESGLTQGDLAAETHEQVEARDQYEVDQHEI